MPGAIPELRVKDGHFGGKYTFDAENPQEAVDGIAYVFNLKRDELSSVTARMPDKRKVRYFFVDTERYLAHDVLFINKFSKDDSIFIIRELRKAKVTVYAATISLRR